MRILLLGDYSNVHWTLAEGLRKLGHEATVVSDGDYWKGYRRDVNLRRRSLGKRDTLRYLWDCVRLMPRLKGYDVVQLINPLFLDFKPERIWPFYRYLRKHNGKMVMGAFGMDYYWVKTCMDCQTFRYSDFNIGSHSRADEPQNRQLIDEWLNGEKGRLCQRVAQDCDAIVAGLYEYKVVYDQWFPEKTRYIPMPTQPSPDPSPCPPLNGREYNDHPDGVTTPRPHREGHGGGSGSLLRFFLGIQQGRSAYKGTDVMLRALERVKAKYPERCKIVKVESVPFDEYKRMMSECDVLLDQLYSYTPAMNALVAMSQGLVVVGGGEPENYDILGETELRPIINVLPDEEDVFRKLEDLVLHPERLPELKRQSVEYVRRHHDYVKVAQQYVDFWTSL
ncbi:MAG: glycosyltransferase family 1 protein [Bacteroidaceae bacterium]|nr:glycosyltransferase family 1 protein [Bacteroidaceae bacterium]